MHVEILCTECGERHTVSRAVPWPTDPAESGSLAELFPESGIPGNLAYLLTIEIWCPQAEAHVITADPAQVFVEPVERREAAEAK